MKAQVGLLAALLLGFVCLLDGCVYGPPDYYRPAYGRQYLEDEPYYYPPSYYRRHRRYRVERQEDGYMTNNLSPDDLRSGVEPRTQEKPPAPLPKPEAQPPTRKSDKPETEFAEHPSALKTNKPGRVKSPFPPYGELDVSGMPSGSLAKDPTSGKIFRVP